MISVLEAKPALILLEHVDVVGEAFARILVIADTVDFAGDSVPEPNSGRISDAQIPRCIDGNPRHCRESAYAPLELGLCHLRGVISALDRGLECFRRR